MKHFSGKRKRLAFRSAMLFIAAGAALFGPGPAGSAEFRDALDRVVRLDGPPSRIVSLAPNLTEILFAVGLGDRVVGVTRFSTYPPEAAQKPNVGSYVHLNAEKIVSLNPDLALGTVDGNERAVVRLLEKAGIPVYVVNPRKVRDVISVIREVGNVCGVPGRAEELAGMLDARMERVAREAASLPKPLVFIQINVRPIVTVNRNTFHHDVIRLAGGRNMTGQELATYPRISVEEVIRRGPDVILISSMSRSGEYEQARKNWLRWDSIPAVKAGRVHLVDSDLLDRPSPRIVEGLERVAGLLHPDKF